MLLGKFSSSGGPGSATSDRDGRSDGSSAEGKQRMRTRVKAGTVAGERGRFLIPHKERIKVGIRI